MNAVVKPDVCDTWNHPLGACRPMLDPKLERRLLEELAECRRTLAEARARDSKQGVLEQTDDRRATSRWITETYRDHDPADSTLGAVFQRYTTVRTELALANMRLVAHVAKRYRRRGVAYADLLQEGFCGLLEAIDRFDLAHQTRLSTYATWWIRQAVQSAVAGGAYPVHLAPRHLRRLAQNQEESGPTVPHQHGQPHATTTTVRRIQAAARPSVSLDEARLSMCRNTSDPTGDRIDDLLDLDEAVGEWMVALRPRERRVLSYRFGLGGSPCLSLSQVGEVLDVSKERVRQIQDAALKVLRTKASHDRLIETSSTK